MIRSRIHSALAATAILLILFTSFCMMAQEGSSLQLPERCSKTKPKNTGGCTNKTRRYFLHETKGCKPSGYCRDAIEDYDTRTGENYFISEQACIEACMIYVRCPALESIPNGNLTDSLGHWGSTVTYTCNEGYSLVGASVRECVYNATWSPQAPMCQAKCPTPELDQDGHFTIAPLQEFYKQGDKIVYSCKEGFVNVAADNRRTCLENGTWSGNEAICEPEVRCPEPELIEHGMPQASGVSIGSVLTYKCDGGFMLHGNNTRHCNQEGEWTGENPVCFKFSIEKCMESKCNDVTNRTITLRQGDRNLMFTPKLSSEIPSLSAMDAKWEPELNDIAGVEIVGHKLKISSVVLNTDAQVRQYTVNVGSYQAFFTVSNIIQESAGELSVSVHPKDRAVNIGDTLDLRCIFKGNPSPEVTWFHNGQRVSADSRRTIEVTPFSSYVMCNLKIEGMTQEDLGNYKCHGNNTYGSKDTDCGVVTSNTDTSSVSKRSVMEESPLCRSKASSGSVTIVGRVKKESRKLRSPGTTTYRVEVNRVLSPNSETVSRKNLRTIVLDESTKVPMKLRRNGLYIMQGTLDESTLLVHQHDSIFTHSPALERSLQDC